MYTQDESRKQPSVSRITPNQQKMHVNGDCLLDETKTETVDSQITVEISNESRVFTVKELQSLKYFSAKLSERWHQSDEQCNDIGPVSDKIRLCQSNEHIGFGVDELTTLLSIQKNKFIPRDCALNNLEALLRCDDFFAEKLIDEGMVLWCFKQHEPIVNFAERQALMKQFSSEKGDGKASEIRRVLKSALEKYEASLAAKIASTVMKHYNHRSWQYAKYDIDTLTDLFCRRFVLRLRDKPVDDRMQYGPDEFDLVLEKFSPSETPGLIDQIISRAESTDEGLSEDNRKKVVDCVVAACNYMKHYCASERYHGSWLETLSTGMEILEVIVRVLKHIVDFDSEASNLLVESCVNCVTKFSPPSWFTHPQRKRGSVEDIMDKSRLVSWWRRLVGAKLSCNNLRVLFDCVSKLRYDFQRTGLDELLVSVVAGVAAKDLQIAFDSRSIWLPYLHQRGTVWILGHFMPMLSSEQQIEFGLCIMQLVLQQERRKDSRVNKKYFDAVNNLFGCDWEPVEDKK